MKKEITREEAFALYCRDKINIGYNVLTMGEERKDEFINDILNFLELSMIPMLNDVNEELNEYDRLKAGTK